MLMIPESHDGSKSWNIWYRGEFRTLSNIEDGAFCENSEQLQPLTIFVKRSALHVWQGSEYASVEREANDEVIKHDYSWNFTIKCKTSISTFEKVCVDIVSLVYDMYLDF